MRKLFVLFLAVISTACMFAQSPEKMSYQAVIRNSSGGLVTSTPIGMRVSILQGSSTGNVVYTETKTTSTNANGLVTTEIGDGIGFSTINWSSGPYFIKIETDLNGGSNYTITSTSQLLTVPYALYAKTAGNGFSGSYLDLTNKPTLFSGDYNNLINKPVLFGGDYNDLRNKPVLFDGKFTSLTDKPTTALGYGLTDVMTTSHLAYGIVQENITNWNTAYAWSQQAYTWSEQMIGWGNHADAGYLKSTTTGINPNFMKVNLINTVNDGLLVFSTPNQQWEVKPITDFASIFSSVSHTHSLATTSADGFMSKEDKTKLSGYPTTSTVGDFMVHDGMNWVIRNVNNFAMSNHGHNVATPVSSGFMSNQDKTKLDGYPTPSVMGEMYIYDGTKWTLGSANWFSPITHTHDGSETKINSSADITVKGKGTVAEPYVLNQMQHTVGETYGGGVVFYVYDNGQHGLIAATSDAGINGNMMLAWLYNGNIRVAGAFANGVNAGRGNTDAMVAMQASLTPTYPYLSTQSVAYAAIYYQAQDGAGVRYNDWYLPSQYEMVLLSNSTATIPGFSKGTYYWSSTEVIDNPTYAYAVYQGSLVVTDKRNSFRVRPIRAF